MDGDITPKEQTKEILASLNRISQKKEIPAPKDPNSVQDYDILTGQALKNDGNDFSSSRLDRFKLEREARKKEQSSSGPLVWAKRITIVIISMLAGFGLWTFISPLVFSPKTISDGSTSSTNVPTNQGLDLE